MAIRRRAAAACAALFLAALAAAQGGATPSQLRAVPSEVPPVLSGIKPIGTTAPNTILHLAVSLQPAHHEELQAFCDIVSDPKSPDYRNFITPEEIGERFGAAKADVDAVTDYLRQFGMNIQLVALNRMAVLADATTAQAEAAFHTTIRDFRSANPVGPGEITFHANTLPAMVPESIARVIINVSGLETYTRPMPASNTTILSPALTRSLYNSAPMFNAGYTGLGRTVAISNWSGFRISPNVADFYSHFNLPVPVGGVGSNISVVTIDGGSGSGAEGVEGDIDIQMQLGMAPLASLIIYDGYNGDLVNVYTREANDNLADCISESYGWTMGASYANACHNQHLAMSAQGITYMACSGDSGTQWPVSWPYPDCEPEVLAVGGTIATVDTTSGARVSEVGWSGSGGGWSTVGWVFNKLPSWQKGSGVPTTHNYRLSPDVAIHASGNGGGAYWFYYTGTLNGSYVGTSFSAPVMAGTLATCEQKIIALGGLPPNAAGKRRFGRIMDLFYSQNGRSDIWHDITSGSNGTLPDSTASSCTANWDYVTGWGAPDFNAFVASQVSSGTTSTALTEANISGAVGQTVVQSATLVRSSDSSPIANEAVSFSVPGSNSVLGTTNSSGVATANYAIPESLGVGTFSISALFAGDTTYAASNAGATLTVSKANTALAVPNQSGSLGQTLSLTATLTRTSDGAVLPSKTVSFKVDGASAGSATTNTSGAASVSFTIPDSYAAGAHTIQASYAGSTLYNAGSGTATLTVVPGSTQTTPSNNSGAYDQTVTLTASLTRTVDNVAVPGRTIDFAVAGSHVGSGTTNSSGMASCTYAIPTTLPLGANTLSASFAGDSLYSTSSGSATLTVSKADTSTTPAPASGSYGQTVSLTAAVKRTTDSGVLAGKSVAFTIDGNAIGTAVTNSNGVATLAYVIPTSLATGSRTLLATFAGDGLYNSSSGSTSLNVSKASTLLVAGDVGGLQGATVSLTATLTRTTDSAALSDETVNFTVDGSLVGPATTDAAGTATLPYTIPSDMAIGAHTIRASFVGDPWNTASTDTATLNVSAGTSVVSGTVSLENVSSPTGLSATLEFRTPGTVTVVYSATITLDSTGGYTANGVPFGTYDVACKFLNWLRQVLPSVAVSQLATAGVDFGSANGDANQDNKVNLLDLSTVLSNFGTSAPPPTDGDLNWDGNVNLLDLSTVLANFGMTGDS